MYATSAAGTVPLHRYWNAAAGDHFYTTSFDELGPGRRGWNHEGIACYVLAATPSLSSEQVTMSEGEDVPATFRASPTTWVQAAEHDRPDTFTVVS